MVSRYKRRLVLLLTVVLAVTGAAPAPAAAVPPPWPLPGVDAATTGQEPVRHYTYDPIDPDNSLQLIPPAKRDWNDPQVRAYLEGLGRHKGSGPPGREAHLLTAWRDYKKRGGVKSWNDYVRLSYTGPLNNGLRGTAFERFFVRVEELSEADGWILNRKIPGVEVTDPDDPAGTRLYRVDGYLPATGGQPCILLELKSGNGIWARQLSLLIQLAEMLGCKIVYVFAKKPTRAALRALSRQANELAAKLGGRVSAQELLVARVWRAEAQARVPVAGGGAGGPANGPANGLATGGQTATESEAALAVENSPASAEEAAEEAAQREQLAVELEENPVVARAVPAAAGAADQARSETTAETAVEADEVVAEGEPVGGVDFSTLELRYLADTNQGGPGLQYAFRADTVPGDQPSYGGRRAAQLSTDAFFVWLALPPTVFTVNLSPDEPERILDPRLARTDAGRVLLEADLLMKKIGARLTHPDTDLGRRYWGRLKGEGDTICAAARMWIVPEPATVHEDKGQLYILDAPLTVKLETLHSKCPGQSPDVGAHNELVYRTMILPEVVKAVNSSPDFADLRRVYVSRVGAQWYRERSASKPTAHSALMDSGDVSRWPSREQWSPQEVYGRFMESYTKGEYNVTRTTEEFLTLTSRTYFDGGVDFTAVLRNLLSGNAFRQLRPTLAATVDRARHVLAPERDGREVWLGGQTTARPLAELTGTSPADRPYLYALILLPVFAWLVAGLLLAVRRRWR